MKPKTRITRQRPLERRALETTALALSWLKQARSPFFLWVHYFDPHSSYDPPRKYVDRFKLLYDGEIAAMDASLGDLVNAVPAENTWILILADHGEMLGEHGEENHGVLLYQGAIHIPLILLGPRVAPGTDTQPACTVDVYPTLLAAAGLRPPEGLQGRNLLEPPDPSRVLLSSSIFGRDFLGFLPSRAVIRSGLKLLDYGGRNDRLFDLVKDPGETLDLAPTRGPVRRDLKKIAVAATFPEPGSITIPNEARKKLAALGYVAGRQGNQWLNPEDGLKAQKDSVKAGNIPPRHLP